MPDHWNKYGPTAPPMHRKPWPRVGPKSSTGDIHTHFASPTSEIHSDCASPPAVASVKAHLDPSTIPLAHFANAEAKALSQNQEEDVRARICGCEERLADLVAMGIALQLVMPPPNQC